MDFFIAVPSVPGFDQKMTGRNVGQKPGGMSANSAVAVARLGHPARLLAAVGGDAAGDMALGQMGVEGVDTRFVAVRGGVSTFMCVVLVSPSAEKSLIRLPTNAYLPDPGDVVPAAFEDVAHVHATYGAPEVTAKAFELAVERGPDLDRHLPFYNHTVLTRLAHLASRCCRNQGQGSLGKDAE